MSRTLFWYIFLDLLRIFALASGVLSAIMSFGGLLRPLYEFGLGVSQVGQILGWSNPAMTAYSLPIAALFATTIVYGRLGSDNEITACRAAGISHLSIAKPAFVLGILTAFASVGLLCFVVPACMLKVEKIIYSNLAELAVGAIERTHQVQFKQEDRDIIVFAQSARVLPADPAHPNNQALEMNGAMFIQYDKADKNKPNIPKDFFMANRAVAYLQQAENSDDVSLIFDLVGGTKFPRSHLGAGGDNTEVSIALQRVGPIPLTSPLPENTKFMDIFRIQSLLQHPEQSQRIGEILRTINRRDQEQAYLDLIARQLESPSHSMQLGIGDEVYELHRAGTPAAMANDRLIITGQPNAPVRLQQIRSHQSLTSFEAGEMRLRAFPDADRQQLTLEIEMLAPKVTVEGDDPNKQTQQPNISRSIQVAMPDEVSAVAARPVETILASSLTPKDMAQLNRNLLKQSNSAISEVHARLSFAVSCFILVMVGCALGMMFRSGNFLSAFAVSVIPALICIALVVTGQHTCENVPSPLPEHWTNPLRLGLGLIWSGNIAVFAIGSVLLGRLQRQ